MDFRENGWQVSKFLDIVKFWGDSDSSTPKRGIKRKRPDADVMALEAKRTALTQAITRDDVTAVSALLALPWAQWGTPLKDLAVGPYDYRLGVHRFPIVHYAAREGSVKVLKLLIEGFGMDINKFTKTAGTPLSRAVHNSHVTCVEYLLRAGSDVNAKVPVCQIRECRVNLVTPLMIAVSRENRSVVRALLASGRCDVNALASLNETALYFAIKNHGCNLDFVQQLLDAGLNPNLKSTVEEPPLLLALKLGRCNVAKLLIARGCDVNIRKESPASFGMTALHMAVELDDDDLCRTLVNAGAHLEVTLDQATTLGSTPLMHCVAGNRSYKALPVLLQAGSNVNAEDKFGRGLCHWLVLNGDDSILAYVLTHFSMDVNKEATDGKQTTPLQYAIITNNAPAMKILLQHNCKVITSSDNPTHSPLEYAVKQGFCDILPALYQAGCDVTAETANGLSQNNGKEVGVHAALRHSGPLVGWLKQVTRKPRSLLELSRLAIRQNLSSDIKSEVEQLELPKVLTRFLVDVV